MYKPNRTIAVDVLIESLTHCVNDIAEYRDDPHEVNCALAFCELAVNIPSNWFMDSERMLVFDLIWNLYGSPTDFIDNLQAGNISFYNKMIPKVSASGKKAKTVEEVVQTMMRMHYEQFCETSINEEDFN